MHNLWNSTGKKGHFWAVDWEIELLNLYVKWIHGGQGLNHTIERMIEESPLVEVYKGVHSQFEVMFCLDHKTSKHSPANMKLTFEKLGQYMAQYETNRFIAGWESLYKMIDTGQVGFRKIMLAIDAMQKEAKTKAEKQEQLENEDIRDEFTNLVVDRSKTVKANQARTSKNTRMDNNMLKEESEWVEDLDDYKLPVEDDGGLFVV